MVNELRQVLIALQDLPIIVTYVTHDRGLDRFLQDERNAVNHYCQTILLVVLHSEFNDLHDVHLTFVRELGGTMIDDFCWVESHH